jgi:hypothetical protein
MIDCIDDDAVALRLNAEFVVLNMHRAGIKLVPLRNERRLEGMPGIAFQHRDRGDEVLGVKPSIRRERVIGERERDSRLIALSPENAKCRRFAQNHHRRLYRAAAPIAGTAHPTGGQRLPFECGQRLVDRVDARPYGELAAVLVQRSQLREHARLISGVDQRIAPGVSGIEKLQPDVGGAQIPERDQVVQILCASGVKARIIPPRPNGIVTPQTMPGRECDARVIVNLHGDGRGLIDAMLYEERRLTEHIQIVDPDLRLPEMPRIA